jgi:hypothetical protein
MSRGTVISVFTLSICLQTPARQPSLGQGIVMEAHRTGIVPAHMPIGSLCCWGWLSSQAVFTLPCIPADARQLGAELIVLDIGQRTIPFPHIPAGQRIGAQACYGL